MVYKRLLYVKNTFPGISEISGKQKKRISETDIECTEKALRVTGKLVRIPFHLRQKSSSVHMNHTMEN